MIKEKSDKIEREKILKKLSKVKMSSIRSSDDKKSNIELGRELDLYIVNEVIGHGLPLFTPKGTIIKQELENFVTKEEKKRGYLYTSTPVMAKSDLYKISGHWQHYKDDMFTLDVNGKNFALRPMTCPFQFALYKRKPRTYHDLPKKYAEIATLFRKEKSGELRGLTRMSQFALADGHVICEESQVEKEFIKVMEFVDFIIETFGIGIEYRFSKWDPLNNNGKYVDNPEAWEKTENMMRSIMNNLKIDFVEEEGEAAFYGPKLDLQFKDIYGKEDTLLTIQIDFALPEKFDMSFLNREGEQETPFIIHRSALGCIERMISYLLEKTQGNLPLWLSPVQVKVLSCGEKSDSYAKGIYDNLLMNDIRCEVDLSSKSIGKKIRNASMEKICYVVVVGDKEEEDESISVRVRDSDDIDGLKLDEFVEKVKEEIKLRIRK